MTLQPLSQAKSAAPLGSESANPVWLGTRGRLNAKDRPLIFNKDRWSRKAVTPKPLVAGEGLGSGPPGPARLSINLAPARGRGQAAQVHEKPSNRVETNLTLADYVAAAYVLAAVAFYPATVWFFLS